MLNIPKVTLTGLTHEDFLSTAIPLSTRFDFMEWGILYSPTRVGDRYAARSWIMNNENLLLIPRKALHLCGDAVPMLLDANPQVTELLDEEIGINRVQLNFNQRKKPIDLDLLNLVMSKFPHITFITQYNSANETVHEAITAPNHQVLFDGSGGTGKSPGSWLPPLPGKVCGYAGGIRVSNIYDELTRIAMICPQDFWVDMESSLRVNDKLDFTVCETILTFVSSFLSLHTTSLRV